LGSRILYEKGIKLKLYGNEVYYTACSLLVILKNSCFNLNPFSYRVWALGFVHFAELNIAPVLVRQSRPAAREGEREREREREGERVRERERERG